MASKYTLEEILTERKCGLKEFDLAVSAVGIDEVLNRTIKTAKEFASDPPWGTGEGGWLHAAWSFGNTWRAILWENKLRKGEISCTFNLPEALTSEQMQYLATELGLNVVDYVPHWGRATKKSIRRPKTAEQRQAARERRDRRMAEIVAILQNTKELKGNES